MRTANGNRTEDLIELPATLTPRQAFHMLMSEADPGMLARLNQTGATKLLRTLFVGGHKLHHNNIDKARLDMSEGVTRPALTAKEKSWVDWAMARTGLAADGYTTSRTPAPAVQVHQAAQPVVQRKVESIGQVEISENSRFSATKSPAQKVAPSTGHRGPKLVVEADLTGCDPTVEDLVRVLVKRLSSYDSDLGVQMAEDFLTGKRTIQILNRRGQ